MTTVAEVTAAPTEGRRFARRQPATCWHPADPNAVCRHRESRDCDCEFAACGAELEWSPVGTWECPAGHELRQYEDLSEHTRKRIDLANRHPGVRWEYFDHRGGPCP